MTVGARFSLIFAVAEILHCNIIAPSVSDYSLPLRYALVALETLWESSLLWVQSFLSFAHPHTPQDSTRATSCKFPSDSWKCCSYIHQAEKLSARHVVLPLLPNEHGSLDEEPPMKRTRAVNVRPDYTQSVWVRIFRAEPEDARVKGSQHLLQRRFAFLVRCSGILYRALWFGTLTVLSTYLKRILPDSRISWPQKVQPVVTK